MRINSFTPYNSVNNGDLSFVTAVGSSMSTIMTYQRVNLNPVNASKSVTFAKDKNNEDTFELENKTYLDRTLAFVKSLYPSKFKG